MKETTATVNEKDARFAMKNILKNIINNIAKSIIKKLTSISEGHMKKETEKQKEERIAFELRFGFGKPVAKEKK